MFCSECGSKLREKDNYCANCGRKVTGEEVTPIEINDHSVENKRVASLVLGIISICGVFLGIFAPIALILSIIGLVLAIKANKKVNSTPGIVLNAIGLFFSVIITIILTLLILFSFNIIRDAWNHVRVPSQSENYGDF